MDTIRLNRRELTRISAIFDELYENLDHGSVVLASQGDNGIGSVLTATFVITHNDIEGEFTVTISDESDW